MRSIFTALEEGEKGGAMELVKRKASECWQMSFFVEGRKVRSKNLRRSPSQACSGKLRCEAEAKHAFFPATG